MILTKNQKKKNVDGIVYGRHLSKVKLWIEVIIHHFKQKCFCHHSMKIIITRMIIGTHLYVLSCIILYISILLEFVHNILVRKIIPHIGGKVLNTTNLRKSSERVTHNKRLHYVSLRKCNNVHDRLRGFSQICRMQTLATNMWSYFSNKVIMNEL